MSGHGHHQVFHPQPVGETPVNYALADLDGFGPYGPELVRMTNLVDGYIGPSEVPAHNIVKFALFAVGEYVERMEHGDSGYTDEGFDKLLQEQAATLTDESLPILARLSVRARLEHDDAREVLDNDPHSQSIKLYENYFTLKLTGTAIHLLVNNGLRVIDRGTKSGSDDGVYDDYVRIEDKLYQEALREREIAKSDHSQRFESKDPSLVIRIADRVWENLENMSPSVRRGRVRVIKVLGGVAAAEAAGLMLVINPGNIDQHISEIGEGLAAIGVAGTASYILNRPTRGVRVAVNRRIDQIEEQLRLDYGEGAGKFEFHEGIEDLVGRIWENDKIQGMADQARDLLVTHLNSNAIRLLPPSRGGSLSEYVSLITQAAWNEVDPLRLHDAEDEIDPLSSAGYVMAIIRRVANKKTPEQLYAYITEGYTPPPEPEPAKPEPGGGGGAGSATGPRPKGRRRMPRIPLGGVRLRGRGKGRSPTPPPHGDDSVRLIGPVLWPGDGEDPDDLPDWDLDNEKDPDDGGDWDLPDSPK